MDTPGVLWPKFEDEIVGQNLALTGAIKDDVLNLDEMAVILCGRLRKIAPVALAERYKLTPEDWDGLEDWELFELIGRKRGFLIRGGEIDYDRTANMLIDEFRGVKIGRISLEVPPEV